MTSTRVPTRVTVAAPSTLQCIVRDMPQSKIEALALHAAAAQEGAAESALGAGRMATLLRRGLIVIVANYLNLLPGRRHRNRYLLLGLAARSVVRLHPRHHVSLTSYR